MRVCIYVYTYIYTMASYDIRPLLRGVADVVVNHRSDVCNVQCMLSYIRAF